LGRVHWYVRVVAVVGASLVGLTLCAAGNAAASGPYFTPPTQLGAAAGPAAGSGIGALVRVVLGTAGDATVAWQGAGHYQGDPASGFEGVFVVDRAPGGGAFGPPRRISADNASGLVLARNAGGVRAAAWVNGSDDPFSTDPAPVRLSIAAPGEMLGAPEDVPLISRAPLVRNDVTDYRAVGEPSIAVTPEGTVLVTYIDNDLRAGGSRAVAVLRRPDGSWTTPQAFASPADYGEEAVADGAGGLHVMWVGRGPGASADDPPVLYFADVGPGGEVGPAQTLSRPGKHPIAGYGAPTLQADRRGDLLAVWIESTFGYGSSRQDIRVGYRPLGGDWELRTLSEPGAAFEEHPTGALDNGGDAVVYWTDPWGVKAAVRPALGDWGVPQTIAAEEAFDDIPVALDSQGNALGITTVSINRGANTQHLVALRLPNGAGFDSPIDLTQPGEPVSRPVVATDNFGNGLVVWAQGSSRQPSSVFAASYSATPPVITAFRTRRGAFVFRISEPARVSVSVSGRRRRVSETASLPQGVDTLPFNSAVAALLRRPGQHRVTIRARDAGPRASRPQSLTLRR
jgi:hypothetical protein